MASKTPVIRHTNIFFYIPQIAILLALIFILKLFDIPHYLLMGISLYFLLSIYLKVLIPKWHRKGVYYLKKGELKDAIMCFQRSYNYFQKNAWIDQYRAFTLFSTSQISYAEMSLMNIIYCYEQLGDKQNAKKYHKILQEKFPNNRYS
jgi:tetratricopeptide (TPR) repeat protein